jgi:hypothetical protein
VAEVLQVPAVAERARAAAARWDAEVAAQEAFEVLLAGPLPPLPDAVRSFREAHTGTRHARAAEKAWM